MAEQQTARRRGIHDVALVLVAAVLIMSPSYLASIVMNRLKLDISVVALMALVLFIVGVVILARVVKE